MVLIIIGVLAFININQGFDYQPTIARHLETNCYYNSLS